LVTGAAGFIGYHLAKQLVARHERVLGIDNLNAYYDVNLKKARLADIGNDPNFCFSLTDITDHDALTRLFEEHEPAVVVHLAAQAGVRYSLENPRAYIDSNIVGFLNILESCRRYDIQHLVFASSSSVYGANTRMPFSVHHNVDHPVSLYAASKKANELMAHAYSHLYGLPATGLRFFTVYGPWGRPDMALFLFTKAILNDAPIDVFNHGEMQRDFTYVDDVVEGVVRLLDRPPQPDPEWSGDAPNPGTSRAPFRLYNIGNSQPVPLMKMIATLEKCLGKTAEKRMRPMQPGDVVATYADVDDLARAVGYSPSTPVEVGVRQFVRWYREYYGPETPAEQSGRT
jgi:UDP-glucuronate 4-epimerase